MEQVKPVERKKQMIKFLDDNGVLLSEISGVEFNSIIAGWDSEFSVNIKNVSDKSYEIVSYCSILEDNAGLCDYLFISINDSKIISFRDWAKKGIKLGKMFPEQVLPVKMVFNCPELPSSLS